MERPKLLSDEDIIKLAEEALKEPAIYKKSKYKPLPPPKVSTYKYRKLKQMLKNKRPRGKPLGYDMKLGRVDEEKKKRVIAKRERKRKNKEEKEKRSQPEYVSRIKKAIQSKD